MCVNSTRVNGYIVIMVIAHNSYHMPRKSQNKQSNSAGIYTLQCGRKHCANHYGPLPNSFPFSPFFFLFGFSPFVLFGAAPRPHTHGNKLSLSLGFEHPTYYATRRRNYLIKVGLSARLRRVNRGRRSGGWLRSSMGFI